MTLDLDDVLAACPSDREERAQERRRSESPSRPCWASARQLMASRRQESELSEPRRAIEVYVRYSQTRDTSAGSARPRSWAGTVRHMDEY